VPICKFSSYIHCRFVNLGSWCIYYIPSFQLSHKSQSPVQHSLFECNQWKMMSPYRVRLQIKCTLHHLLLSITGLHTQWHSQNMLLAWAFCGHHSYAQSSHGHRTVIARAVQSWHGNCMVTTRQLHGHDTAVHGRDTAVHGHDTVAQHARTSHGTGNSMHGSCTVMHAKLHAHASINWWS